MFCTMIQISLECLSICYIKLSGDKPLFKPIMAQCTNAIMSPGLDESGIIFTW